MSFFVEVKKVFSNNEEIFTLRYNSSKIVFILSSFIFFLNYFFIANSFYYDLLIKIFPITSIVFLLSLYLYSCFLIEKYFKKIPKIIKILVFVLLFFISLILAVPFILPKWFINIF